MSDLLSKGLNRLYEEKSPYLRQHARNPVDWRPWSDAAFSEAREADRPVIVSIGYSSCHWCHVMQHESFEDVETARIMNENFICVKVDREERPDLDSLYMKAVQAMTGQGGWPLTVFVTPQGEPFYGGTYFPPEDSYGLPSFKHVLEAVARLYRENKEGIGATASGIKGLLSKQGGSSTGTIDEGLAAEAFSSGMLFHDQTFGGFGNGTKFPQAMFLEFVIRHYERTRSDEAAAMLTKTLNAMAEGGIYDQLGGGFHRYSVDKLWAVPHFEKMLYDNALLAEVYRRAAVSLKEPVFKEISLDIIAWMLTEMRSERGGFHSSIDADSDGREGAYYLWDYDEYMRIIEGADAAKYAGYYSVVPSGNLDGMNTLRINRTKTSASDRPPSAVTARMKAALKKARSERKAPSIDRKVITAWNGLAITALANAGAAFGMPQLLDAAERCAGFILTSSVDSKGRLMRYWLDHRASIKAGLEDYALLGSALLALGTSGAKARPWLDEALKLTESMIELFYDKSDGRFYDIAADQGALFIRERDIFDSDIPSGNSAAAELLFNISQTSGDVRYELLARGIVTGVEAMRSDPLSHGRMLCVVEQMLAKGGIEPHDAA